MFLKRNYFDRATACNATHMIAKAFFVRHSVRLSMASAVTPSEKSSIITNRKSTTVYALSKWARDEHRTLSPSPPNGGSKMQSVQSLNMKLQYLRNGTR